MNKSDDEGVSPLFVAAHANCATMVRALVSRSSPWTPWTQKTTIYGLKHAPPGGHTRSIFAMVDSQVVCVRGYVRHPWRRQARSGATANSLSGCYRKEACV